MQASTNYTGLAGYRHDSLPAAGVLLVNLGTPEAPTAKAVRPYLAEFLGDPRVIEYPRWLWMPILHGVILRVRPPRSAEAYAKIWTEQGSPLRVFSESLATGMQAELGRRHRGPIRVALAMRYGQPSVADTIAQLQREGVRRLLVLPLYPQYSATSTGSVLDAVADTLKTLRWPPELRIVNDYHAEAAVIDALAASVRAHWDAHGRGDKLLLSFHGIPERYFHAGDPYFCQCQATARLLRERLGMGEDELVVSFQSRVGRERWLHPYTDETVRQLATDGVRKLDVLCPGFAVDCLETLEEVAMQNRDFFVEAGGETLRYIPALNDQPAHIRALTDLALRHMQGWPEVADDYDPASATETLADAHRRASALRES
ncbi:ferrochelatase [Oleiagrimonas sp. MCCC 1A03011]|uniref:ferrochelatase n=1 Tax=Oleiagrimonas sp. MCCC 1A03011 TaxID=1926883 RepID=UPI000DC5DF5C|nr:ferrochelatase [Oleiagrimonas sp. MCCC 1A03011]RAP58176.1 ferrochelatase [Oleiagrimonas sp. MCCC 1A03011]